jgi:hypothetical protein
MDTLLDIVKWLTILLIVFILIFIISSLCSDQYAEYSSEQQVYNVTLASDKNNQITNLVYVIDNWTINKHDVYIMYADVDTLTLKTYNRYKDTKIFGKVSNGQEFVLVLPKNYKIGR